MQDRPLLLAALVGLLAFCVVDGAAEVPAEYIVVLKEGATEAEWQALYDEYAQSGTVLSKFSIGGAKKLMLLVSMTETEILDLQFTFPDLIAMVEPNYKLHSASLACPETTVTSGWHQKRATNAVTLGESWIHNSTWGAGTTLYVVDSGVTCAHAEFSGDRCTVGFNSVAGEDDTDLSGHGTHVASIAVGNTYGIAPIAKLVAAKCLDSAGVGTIVGCMLAIDWAVTAHVTSGSGVTAVLTVAFVIGAYSAALEVAVQNAISAGIVVVTGAGNTNSDACQSYPAGFPNVITVGGTTINPYQGGTRDEVAEWSNQGSCVDIFAPGESVTGASSVVGESTRHSGTSMSTPLVAGMLLSYISNINPTATVEEARAWLVENAQSGLGNLMPGSPDLLAHLPCVEDPPAPIDGDRHEKNCYGVYEELLGTSTLAYIEAEVAANDWKCYKVQCPVGTPRVLAGVYEHTLPVDSRIAFNGELSLRVCEGLAVSPRDSMAMRVTTSTTGGTVKAMVSCQEERWTRVRTMATTFGAAPTGLSIEHSSDTETCVTCQFLAIPFLGLFVSRSVCFFPPAALQTVRLTASAAAGSFKVGSVESHVARADGTKAWFWSAQGLPYLGAWYGGGDGLEFSAIPEAAIVVRIKVGSASGNGTLHVRFIPAVGESCSAPAVAADVGAGETFYFAGVCPFGVDALVQVAVESLGPDGHALIISQLDVFGSRDDYPTTYPWLAGSWDVVYTLAGTTLSFGSNPLMVYGKKALYCS